MKLIVPPVFCVKHEPVAVSCELVELQLRSLSLNLLLAALSRYLGPLFCEYDLHPLSRAYLVLFSYLVTTNRTRTLLFACVSVAL